MAGKIEIPSLDVDEKRVQKVCRLSCVSKLIFSSYDLRNSMLLLLCVANFPLFDFAGAGRRFMPDRFTTAGGRITGRGGGSEFVTTTLAAR